MITVKHIYLQSLPNGQSGAEIGLVDEVANATNIVTRTTNVKGTPDRMRDRKKAASIKVKWKRIRTGRWNQPEHNIRTRAGVHKEDHAEGAHIVILY